MESTQTRLSERLKLLAKDCQTQEMSLASLTTSLGIKSHALIVLFFSVPFLLPIPVPGLSIILGALIALSGIAILLDKPIWLPRFISHKTISSDLLAKIFHSASNIIKKIEFIFKPRFFQISDTTFSRKIAGLVILVSGTLLFLPLPPGTNFPPALVCVLLAIGLLEKDGLIMLLGFSLFVAKIILIFNLYSYFSNWIEAHILSCVFIENIKSGRR